MAQEAKESVNEKLNDYMSQIENVWKAADKSSEKQCNFLIILRGFPGSGKSTLSRAIKEYFGDSECVICSFDKYHWKEGVFSFNPSIHRQTKQWCKEEIISSFLSSKRAIIVDNAHLAKWQYADYIVKYAQMYKYKVRILEIQSCNDLYSIYDHIKHLNKNEHFSECLLCTMQHNRCKMKIKKEIYTKFINQYEKDTNAVTIPMKNEKWTKSEIEKLLSTKKEIDYTQYADDEWKKNQKKQREKRSNLDMSLDEIQQSNRRYSKKRKFGNRYRKNQRY